MPDREYAAVDPMQARCLHLVLNGVLTEAESDELTMSDDSVLLRRPNGQAFQTFSAHIAGKVWNVIFRPYSQRK